MRPGTSLSDLLNKAGKLDAGLPRNDCFRSDGCRSRDCSLYCKQILLCQSGCFFLNPVSIIITGYHNQFDTIAVLFALLSILYINEEESFSKKDIFAILFLSLSLMTKHILFLLPVFILLTNNIPLKKRIVYAIVPPVVFLLSFAPFTIQNNAALQGIINNVFLYRSFNNAPLLDILYKQIGFPSGPRIYVYGIMMLVPAWLVRREKYEHILLIYL